MGGYLGEFPVNWRSTPQFASFKTADWAVYFIEHYGRIDGAHHKTWVMDQVVRILKGTEILVTVARWGNGESEYRIQTAEPSKEYQEWRKQFDEVDEEGELLCEYDEGIAP